MATPAITATDTIIEVSEMNFMFVVRVLRLDDALSSIELSGNLTLSSRFYIAVPQHAPDNDASLHFMSDIGRATTGYLARHSYQNSNTNRRNIQRTRCIRG